MLEDIKQQPDIVEKILNQYCTLDGNITGLNFDINENISGICIVASGSSRNVGNISRYMFEKITELKTEVDYASEFAHRNTALRKHELVIAISQSGETADTFAALKKAKDVGAYTIALTNNPESKIHKSADYGIEIGAGKERSIAATKSFTGQLINLYILALYIAQQRKTYSEENIKQFISELRKAKNNIEKIIENIEQIDTVASKIKDSRNLVLLGRGINYPVTREGALKIKETSYIDANGYPSGEFLHGHMAVIDETIPVISIISPKSDNAKNYDFSISNTEKVKQKRNPPLVIIKSEKDNEIQKIESFKDALFLNIPDSFEEIFAMYSIIAIQLLALRTAEMLGRDVNNPRDLQKAVTSE